MLIKSTNLSEARLMDYVQVMTINSGFLAKENLESLQLKPAATAFDAALSSLESSVKQAQKTGYTEQIVAADEQRDSIFSGFTASLRGMTRFPDASVAQAAQQLLLVTDKFGQGVIRLPQREESAVLTSIITEMKTEANASNLLKTGLTVWVEKLEEANRTFDLLYAERSEKEAEFITGLTRTERTAMQTAFENLVRAIEAYAYINGETAYKPLSEKINTEVAKVQQAAKTRSTANSKVEGADEVVK